MSGKEFDVTFLPQDHILNGYKIVGMLGKGGFGITYKATDINLDKLVAIKEYYPNDIASRQNNYFVQPVISSYEQQYYWGLKRFIEEARTVSKFEHPNLARVYAFFESNNTGYMVMKYEKGQNIKEIRKDRQFTELEMSNLVTQLLDALELLHSSVYIHRDIKPENIIIRDDGSPVIIDFGSARNTVGQTERDLTCLVSSGYAPIEQYTGNSTSLNDKQGPWTDIYSLSATLYYAVSGISPSSAINRGDSLLQTNRDTYVPIELIAKNQYSKRFLKAIDRGLSFKQKDRPKSIAEWRSMFDSQGIIQDSLKKFKQPKEENIITVSEEEFNRSEIQQMQTGRNLVNKVSAKKAMFVSLGVAFILPFINGYIDTVSNKDANMNITEEKKNNYIDDKNILHISKDLIMDNLYPDSGNTKNNNSKIAKADVNDKNFSEAVKTLMPMAEKGEPFAQHDLGIIFFIRDIDESLKWFHMAAEQGYGPAQKQLGFIYDNGIRVEEDDAKAFYWYNLAAEQGISEAQFMLGTMYLKGLGTKVDEQKGEKWLEIAGQKGLDNAKETIAQLNRQLELMTNSAN